MCIGWPESAHRQTGTACRAASLDTSDWSAERDNGLVELDSLLDWVKGTTRILDAQLRGRHLESLAIIQDRYINLVSSTNMTTYVVNQVYI